MKESKALIIFSMIEKIKFLFAHKNFMKYFKNTSWLFGEKILRMIVALFVGVWVARYLGPEKFGLLSYAQSFVAIFSAFATLGLEGIVARELVKSKSEVEKTLETSFWLKFFGAILLYIIIFIAFEFIPVENNTQKLIFIVAGTSFFHSFSVIE
ncbi:oligosaccharide flippase family protein, partial [Flavobacteriaceae bacterium]|nr:oligosaccharide flippase family protein [Flavobacteriaceae bacterium]